MDWRTRRRFLGAVGLASVGGLLSGCQSDSSGQPSPTGTRQSRENGTPQRTETEETTPEEETEPVESVDWVSFEPDIHEYGDDTGFKVSNSEYLNELGSRDHDEKVEFAYQVAGSYDEFTDLLDHQLGIDTYVLHRSGNGGYHAILTETESGEIHKHFDTGIGAIPNATVGDEGDESWIAVQGEESTDDGSAEENMAGMWDGGLANSAPTNFTNNQEYISHYIEDNGDISDSTWQESMAAYSRRNDSIIVGENGSEGELCFTQEGAEAVEDIQDWYENDDFGSELELVRNSSIAYHTDLEQDILGEEHLQIDVVNSSEEEVVAIEEDNPFEYENPMISLTDIGQGQSLVIKGVTESEYEDAVNTLYERS